MLKSSCSIVMSAIKCYLVRKGDPALSDATCTRRNKKEGESLSILWCKLLSKESFPQVSGRNERDFGMEGKHTGCARPNKAVATHV